VHEAQELFLDAAEVMAQMHLGKPSRSSATPVKAALASRQLPKVETAKGATKEGVDLAIGVQKRCVLELIPARCQASVEGLKAVAA
jgi:hypothetical protein